MSYPPPCFLTTLQYTKLHGKESLGIIFPTFPKERKNTRRNMKSSKTNSNNINTGYPALDPTANKYLRFRLGDFCFLLNVVFMFVCCPSVCLYVVICVVSIVNAKA